MVDECIQVLLLLQTRKIMRKCDIKNCTAGEPHSTVHVPARLMYTHHFFLSRSALRMLYAISIPHFTLFCEVLAILA